VSATIAMPSARNPTGASDASRQRRRRGHRAIADGETQDAGYLAGATFSWAIAMLDLGVFLPATVATCVGLVHGSAWAHKALYLVAGWFGLVAPAVAAMAIAMYVNDDPNASAGNAVFMTLLGLAFAALALTLYRPLFGRPPRM
jgi:hypothetical protein